MCSGTATQTPPGDTQLLCLLASLEGGGMCRSHILMMVAVPCTRMVNLAQWPHVKKCSQFKFRGFKIHPTVRGLRGPACQKHTEKTRPPPPPPPPPRARARPSNPPRAIAPIRGAGASKPQHRMAKVVAQQPGCYGMHECSPNSPPFERVPVRPCIATRIHCCPAPSHGSHLSTTLCVGFHCDGWLSSPPRRVCGTCWVWLASSGEKCVAWMCSVASICAPLPANEQLRSHCSFI